MRVKAFISIMLACLALMCAKPAHAQSDSIKVKFEIDGEEAHQPFRIEISFNGLVLKPKVKNGSFVFPPELLSEEKVDLRFICGKYDLSFENISLKKFNDIVIGVDTEPFAEENLPTNPPPDKELVFIYYMSMGTVQLITHVYK